MKIIIIINLWFLWFLNFSVRSVISPLLPVIEDYLSVSHALAGSLFLYSSLGFTISVFMAGLVSRYIGYKRSILFCFLALILALSTIRYADTYYHLAAIIFLMGLVAGIYFPCAIPFITSVFTPDKWGKAISFHETAPPSSFFMIPILVALVLKFFDWQSFFLFLSGACLIFIAIFYVIAPDPRLRKEQRRSYSTVLVRKDFWFMTMLWIISMMATNGIYSIVPLYLVKERGIEFDLANTIFGISRGGGLLATILIGFFLDRFPLKKILLVIIIITGLSTISLAIVNIFWLLVVVLFIQATISIVFFPSAILTISKLTSIEERGTFVGLTLGVGSIFGVGITPLVLGMVADRWNFQTGIFFLGLLTMFSPLLLRGFKKL